MSAGIEKLNDHLLAEILQRLTYKDSRRCLSVCKAWSLLVSQASFLKKLMTFHRTSSRLLPETYHVILNFNDNNDQEFGDGCCGWQGNDSKALPVLHRSLDFLPNREEEEVRVLRVSGDLFLCGHWKKSFRPKRAYSGCTDDYYYVCNIITKQWVALPPRPCDSPKSFQFYSSRFYKEQDPTGCSNDGIYNAEYEYIVLVMDEVPKEICFLALPLKFEVFSSKYKVWKTLTLDIPRDFYFLSGSWLRESCFDEGILWYSNESRVIRINIKELQDKPRLIDLPDEMVYPSHVIRENIGVCNGRLCLSRCHTFPSDFKQFVITSHVMVWELEEEEGAGKWHFVHKVPLGDVCFHPNNTFIIKQENNNNVGLQMCIRNIRFHPNDPDILFIEQDKCIVEWNARTKDFKHYQEAVPFFGRLLLTPPWCPTPVLPLNDMHQKNCVLDPPILPVLDSIFINLCNCTWEYILFKSPQERIW